MSLESAMSRRNDLLGRLVGGQNLRISELNIPQKQPNQVNPTVGVSVDPAVPDAKPLVDGVADDTPESRMAIKNERDTLLTSISQRSNKSILMFED